MELDDMDYCFTWDEVHELISAVEARQTAKAMMLSLETRDGVVAPKYRVDHATALMEHKAADEETDRLLSAAQRHADDIREAQEKATED